jgi:hypothetical protein
MKSNDTLPRPGAGDDLAVATATLAAAGIAAVAVPRCPDPACSSCEPVDRDPRRHGDSDLVAA